MMILFLTIIFVAIIAHNNAFSTTSTTTAAIFRTKKLSKLSNNLLYRLSMSSSESKITEIFLSPKEDKEVVIPNYDDETEEERYKRTKLAEIAEKQALEVFVSRNTGKWECQSCGYIYAEAKGNEKYNIKAGTPFDQIEKFRCPQVGTIVCIYIAHLMFELKGKN